MVNTMEDQRKALALKLYQISGKQTFEFLQIKHDSKTIRENSCFFNVFYFYSFQVRRIYFEIGGG